LNQGPVEVGATPSPWQQCPEGGVQRPYSSTDFSRSCEGGQSRIVLFLYRQRQQTHGSVPIRASKLYNLIREKRSSGYHLPEIDLDSGGQPDQPFIFALPGFTTTSKSNSWNSSSHRQMRPSSTGLFTRYFKVEWSVKNLKCPPNE
jgi:hypothetical protein